MLSSLALRTVYCRIVRPWPSHLLLARSGTPSQLQLRLLPAGSARCISSGPLSKVISALNKKPINKRLANGRRSKTKARGLTRWTKEEDRRLMELVTPSLFSRRPIRWTQIAKSMQSRSSDQCYKRWTAAVNPTLVGGRFSAEEDELILRGYGE